MDNHPAELNGQVYLITNKITGKQYVGQTKTHQWRTDRAAWIPYGYQERFRQHVRNTANFEKFGRCRALNSAMQKYRVENFTVDLLEECPVESLDDVEIFYISELNTMAPNGYNLEAGGNKNKWASEETRSRQTESRKKYYETEQGKTFKKAHGEFLGKFNTSNNDKKKVNKYSGKAIDRIRAVNSPNESQIYIYVYCDGSPKRNKMRVHYSDLATGINRVRELVNTLTNDPSKVEFEDLPV